MKLPGWRFWRSWSIGLRMAFITMLPVVFLFTAFVWYSWYAHRAQVAEELAERGRILARALAETSEYNVISGNLTDLRLTINGLVQSRVLGTGGGRQADSLLGQRRHGRGQQQA